VRVTVKVDFSEFCKQFRIIGNGLLAIADDLEKAAKEAAEKEAAEKEEGDS